MIVGSKPAARAAERALQREADAYWGPARVMCQRCELVEVEEQPWVCEQCAADDVEDDADRSAGSDGGIRE